MEFGGGLSRFSNSPSFPANNCREIVEIPGGSEWKIRQFQEKFENFAWKYPGCSVIVNYQLNRLQTKKPEPDGNLKRFYGKVSHFMSPLEISIQPKYLSSIRKSIMREMQTFYEFQRKNLEILEICDDWMFPTVACAVRESGIWYRARISAISGKEHVVVELIDFGTQVLVPRHQCLPLLRRFGRIPPLCLKCRVDGLTVNDLEIKDLHDFKNVIAECNALFRVEIKSLDDPFVVDLFHPTISELNVCQKFMPAPEAVGKVERHARSWERHCRKMNEEFDDDVDLDSLGDFPRDVTPREKYVKRLAKCQKAPRFETDTLLVEYVENSQLVYLQYPWQRQKRAEIDEKLVEVWPRLPRVPREDPRGPRDDHVYVIRNAKSGLVRRAIVTEDSKSALLLDYGRFVKISQSADLRYLPASEIFSQEPMVTVVSLQRGINLVSPHHSETQFLRQKLVNGTKVNFKWDRNSKQTPLRGKLTVLGERESLNEQMVHELKRLKIDGRCRVLDVYRPYVSHVMPRGTHVYRSTCHPHYSKGNEEFFEMTGF